MPLTINTDCTVLTVTSDNGYIENINTADGSKCCHVLEIGNNCCTPSVLPIRSLYNLGYTITNCTDELVDGNPGHSFDVSITGIQSDCVSSFTYPTTNNISTETETNPRDLTFNFKTTQTTGSINFRLAFNTCTNLEYVIEFTVIINVGDFCSNLTLGLPTITYPDLPTGVSVVGNTITISPMAFNQTGTNFADGVYYMALSETLPDNTIGVESDTELVNCITTCRVIDYLTKYPCDNIYLLFEALKFAINDCDTITYQQQCDIWKIIGKKLGYFDNNPCQDSTDCGCNK